MLPVHVQGFFRAGHWPTLLCAFLYFDVSFMVWVPPGALANAMAADFGLDAAGKGFLVAVPLLGGAVLRIVLGLATDRYGARRTAFTGLCLTLVPLTLGWLWADSIGRLLFVGLLLGVAGASFAAALPLASRWYPPEYQGMALGIAGAGNSGTALATFFGPRLAETWGWHAVFGLALVPVIGTLVALVLLAREGPGHPPERRLTDYGSVLAQRDTAWFCLFYAVTFGGFVGLASFLNVFFHDQYALGRVRAADLATLCVVAGSFLRPVGGHLADRLGGIRVLTAVYLGVAVTVAALAALPSVGWGTLLLFAAMGLLGVGNGAVFQLVPQRYPRDVGVITGLVGAAGGIGGFLLPSALGGLKQVMGTFAGGFALFALAAFSCCGILLLVSRVWQGTFVRAGGLAYAPVSVPEAVPYQRRFSQEPNFSSLHSFPSVDRGFSSGLAVTERRGASPP
jgi:MFS transporter, NNP family, nitrate/nitrite transporter